MTERVGARRLSDAEGRQLQQVVRRGKHDSIRVRRALIIMASASGTTVPAIATLVQADEDTVRRVIRRINEVGLACLDLGGRVAVPAGSAVTTRRSSSRRPGRVRRSWAVGSPTGVCASWWGTWPTTRSGWSGCDGSGCGSFCATTRSPSSALGPGRSPPTRCGRPSWTASRRSRPTLPRAVFRLRPVRAAVDPPAPRRSLGAADQASPAASHLPAHPRHPLLPRLLQPW
jgi:hypothetical protein